MAMHTRGCAIETMRVVHVHQLFSNNSSSLPNNKFKKCKDPLSDIYYIHCKCSTCYNRNTHPTFHPRDHNSQFSIFQYSFNIILNLITVFDESASLIHVKLHSINSV